MLLVKEAIQEVVPRPYRLFTPCHMQHFQELACERTVPCSIVPSARTTQTKAQDVEVC